jgi:hypothetical protein
MLICKEYVSAIQAAITDKKKEIFFNIFVLLKEKVQKISFRTNPVCGI